MKIDERPPVTIGFRDGKSAIKSYIEENEHFGLKKSNVEYHDIDLDGTTISFATVYNRHYRDKTLLSFSDVMRRSRTIAPVGICVEGVRVEFEPPGFTSRSGFLSIANCRGKAAPKTNVARTALESESEKNRISAKSLDAYLAQIQSEIQRLQDVEEYSLSYAIDQFPFISGQLLSPTNLTDDDQKTIIAEKFSLFILDTEKERRAVSAADLKSSGGFWMVESQTMTSLNNLLQNAPSSVTCRQIASAARFKGDPLPNGDLITNSLLGSTASFLVKKTLRCQK